MVTEPISYLIGYLYAIFTHFLIKMVMDETEQRVGKNPSEKLKWQKTYVGIIERVLYVTSLLLEHGEFVAIWVGLKVAVPYLIWTPKLTGQEGLEDQENEKALEARAKYMDSLYGNALSIIHAAIGYGLIIWIDRREGLYVITVPLLAYIGTWTLKRWLKSQS